MIRLDKLIAEIEQSIELEREFESEMEVELAPILENPRWLRRGWWELIRCEGIKARGILPSHVHLRLALLSIERDVFYRLVRRNPVGRGLSVRAVFLARRSLSGALKIDRVY